MPEAQTSPQRVYRHTLPVRLAHWTTVLCLPILVMSGLQIFNAHPALYWGERSDRDKALLRIDAVGADDGTLIGVTTLFGVAVETTGVLGVSTDSAGHTRYHGFPAWATLPSDRWLAMGRRWHFFFAWIFVLNGMLFAAYSVAGRHLWRDLLPSWTDLRHLGRSLADHVRFRHQVGEEAARYNVLQRLAYTGVIFGLGPLIVLTGLAMSPRMDAAFPWLVSIFGGRQSARTIHFVACFAFIGYVAVHVAMVAITGLWNNVRSMITGWSCLPAPHDGARP
jgi:thiosulfate reductase cytochrome b subunit